MIHFGSRDQYWLNVKPVLLVEVKKFCRVKVFSVQCFLRPYLKTTEKVSHLDVTS